MSHDDSQSLVCLACLLRLPEVIRRTGLSRSTIYEAIKQGQFPKPVQLTAAARAWHSVEIDAWIAARLAARNEGIQV